MVLQILLRPADELDRHQPVVGPFHHPVDQLETHGRNDTRPPHAAPDPRPANHPPVPPETDDAICLRHYDWSETSQTVVLLTLRHGIVRALAKGSKRPKSTFSGGVELLTRAEIQLYPRPAKDLDLLGSWDLTDPHTHIRRALPALNTALYAAELTARLLDTHDPHPRTFHALTALLGALRKPGAAPHAILRFQWALLTDTGYAPRLDRDAETGGDLPDTATLGFDLDAGGLIPDPGPQPTTRAQRDDPLAPIPGPWRVRRETVDLLRLIAQNEETPAESPPAVAVLRSVRLLHAWATTRIGRVPASAAAFFAALDRAGTGGA